VARSTIKPDQNAGLGSDQHRGFSGSQTLMSQIVAKSKSQRGQTTNSDQIASLKPITSQQIIHHDYLRSPPA
jgi:hypothetical protein